jgi:two-component system, OmpR family, sensor kinase
VKRTVKAAVMAGVSRPEQQAIKRARARLTVQLAIAITVAITVVGGLSYLVMIDRQRTQIDKQLRSALRSEKIGSVDPCMWLFVLRDGQLLGADAAPSGLPMREVMQVVADGPAEVSAAYNVNGTRYSILTARTGDEVRQAVFDGRYQLSDQRQMAVALLLAELIGLLVAAVVGWLLARRAIAPLEEALVKQRQFVADASHELRTPLTRLYTRAQLLLQRPDTTLPPDVSGELRRIVDNSRQLHEIVDDLLRSADLTASRPVGARVDLAAIAGEVADAERVRASESGVVITTHRSTDTTHVSGVESALRRMVSALVDNAIRHSRSGGHVWLTVGAVQRGRLVELIVADDGAGLDPADRNRIFERFHRGRTSSSDGHGLGLALVREVVQAHGGTVTADGRPGAGAAFTVRLPAATAPRPRPR